MSNGSELKYESELIIRETPRTNARTYGATAPVLKCKVPPPCLKLIQALMSQSMIVYATIGGQTICRTFYAVTTHQAGQQC